MYSSSLSISDIRKQIAIFDLQKIYEDEKIDIVKNLEIKKFKIQ